MSAVYLLAAVLIGRFVHRALLGRLGDNVAAHLVRLPGNLLHELAHAVALLATGYTIVGFTVSLFDAKGRGGVHPGPAWIGIARPWLANLLAPVAPIGAGVLALAWLLPWSGVPALPTSLGGVLPTLAAVPWDRWELWLALGLGFSIAAEIAPSDVDLAAWWRPALLAAVLLGAAGYGLEQWRPGLVLGELPALDAAIRPYAARALSLVVWSGVVAAPFSYVVGKIRG